MSQKWSDLNSTNTADRLRDTDRAAVQLSDGTLIFIDYDGTSHYLKYSSDHATINTIATIATGFGFPATSVGSLAVAVDSLDNIYVTGVSSTGGHSAVQAFTKGSGYTWTAQTVLHGKISGSSWGAPDDYAVVWCNTGGGTSSKGHLLVLVGEDNFDYGYAICDAGAALAGTGTLITASGAHPTFMGTPGSGDSGIDVEADGFSATAGLAVFHKGAAVHIGSWAVSSSGTLSTNILVSSLANYNYAPGTFRLVRYASNAFAVAFPSTTATHYAIATFSKTALLQAPVDSGAPTNMPLNAGTLSWDFFLDPVTANKVWIIALAAVSGGNQQVYRLGCAVAGPPAWDAAVVADDLLTSVNTTGADLRAIKTARSGTIVDWQAFAKVSATNYALLGDYTQFASAPSVPTLTAPANASFDDVSGSATLTATYNSTDAANQNAYALRQKIGAGAYNYWNAGSTSWQSTIVWNPIITAPGSSFSVAVAGLSNANTYNWSFASQEANANLQGSFAADFTFTGQAAPTLAITGPSGTVVSSQPTVTWTCTPASGAAQTAYRLVVYSAAEYTAAGFVAGTTAGDYDSGVVSSGASSQQVTTDLVNGTSYRAYVQVTETGSEVSIWQYSAFTLIFDAPAQSALTATYDPTLSRVVLTVQGRDSLLTTNQGSLETDTTGWAALTNATIARSLAQSLDGTASLSLTSVAAGDMSATTPTGTSGQAVQPSTQYTVLANFRSAVTARQVQVQVNWYQSSGAASAIRASDVSATPSDTTSGWTQAQTTVISPSDAAFAAVVVTVLATAAASSVHYVDEISLAPGASTVWTSGGLIGGGTVLLEYSDDSSNTWQGVRGAAAAPVASGTEQAIVYDYEAPPLASRQYRARITVGLLASIPSAVQSATPTPTLWWLKDPLNPAINSVVHWSGDQPAGKQSEAQQAFKILGRPHALVVADVIHGQELTLDFTCLTPADYAALLTLRNTQHVLLLQADTGEQWYLRLGPDLSRTTMRARDTANVLRMLKLTAIEVDTP